MTEQEWNDSDDPLRRLAYLQGKISDRKLRLFVIACAWEVRDLIDLMEQQQVGYGLMALAVGEEFVEGRAEARDVSAAIIDSIGIVDSGSGPFGHLLGSVLPSIVCHDAYQGAYRALLGTASARDRAVRGEAALRRGERMSLPSEESRAEGRAAQRQALARLSEILRDIANPFHNATVGRPGGTPVCSPWRKGSTTTGTSTASRSSPTHWRRPDAATP